MRGSSSFRDEWLDWRYTRISRVLHEQFSGKRIGGTPTAFASISSKNCVGRVLFARPEGSEQSLRGELANAWQLPERSDFTYQAGSFPVFRDAPGH